MPEEEVCHFVDRHGSAERAAAAVAACQLAVITTRQLRLAGVNDRAVGGRERRGLIVRVHRGVYLWGTAMPVPGAVELAGCLACGPGTLVSHESAAWLWGLAPRPNSVDVTVPGRNCRSRPGLHVSRVAVLGPPDQSDVCGIPVTAPARTLFDLAGRRDDDVLEHAISEAFARQLVTERELHAILARSRGRRGGTTLRRQLAPGPTITRARSERLLQRIVRDAGLPRPRTNVKVEGKRVDAWWPEHNLVVEIDGYPFHGHRQAFEADRATDQRLVAAGYRVMRITWRQLVQQPLLVAANLAAALARAR